MTPATLLASARALIEANPAAHGLLDRCSVVNRTAGQDSYGGSTMSDSSTISDVPCLYEERLNRVAQVAGGSSAYVTHNIFLIASDETRAIQPDYKIVVAARDDIPELTFESPVMLSESLSPLVHVGVVLKP